MKKINFSDISIQIIKITFESRFIMARVCRKVSPLSHLANRLFFEGDDIMVLPRDNTIQSHSLMEVEINSPIEVPEDTILPSQILKEMILKSKYHFIMNTCICRVSSQCNDYPHDLGCLFLGKGAQRISSKLGKSVTVEEALQYIDKCQKAGLVHIIGRNKIDSVWLNTGPKEELLSICSCCPCCCLWKMAPELPANIGKGFTPLLGSQINLNLNLCIGCGQCTKGSCFVDAIHMFNGKAVIDTDKCRICGRCAETCSQGAVIITLDKNTIQRSIQRVKTLVDVEKE